jgi:hypothetical protein
VPEGVTTFPTEGDFQRRADAAAADRQSQITAALKADQEQQERMATPADLDQAESQHPDTQADRPAA